MSSCRTFKNLQAQPVLVKKAHSFVYLMLAKAVACAARKCNMPAVNKAWICGMEICGMWLHGARPTHPDGVRATHSKVAQSRHLTVGAASWTEHSSPRMCTLRQVASQLAAHQRAQMMYMYKAMYKARSEARVISYWKLNDEMVRRAFHHCTCVNL